MLLYFRIVLFIYLRDISFASSGDKPLNLSKMQQLHLFPRKTKTHSVWKPEEKRFRFFLNNN